MMTSFIRFLGTDKASLYLSVSNGSWSPKISCASLRCQTLKHINNTLRASIQKHPFHQNWPVNKYQDYYV
ncbi:hypothetical protein ACROYT_G031446 [Oculina patagonica]